MTDNKPTDAFTLEVLLHEHSQVREASRNHWTLVAALATIGIGVLGGVLAMTRQDVPLQAWAIVPLVPIAITALLVQQVAMHQVRSRYNQMIEDAVRQNIRVSAGSVQIPIMAQAIRGLFWPTLPAKRRQKERIAYLVTVGPIVALTGIEFFALFFLNLATVVAAFWQLRGWYFVVVPIHLLFVAIVTLAGWYAAVCQDELFRHVTGKTTSS